MSRTETAFAGVLDEPYLLASREHSAPRLSK